MKYSAIPSAKNLVLAFKEKGIKDIVISPGSRNAPLILSFTADSFFNCFSIVDERSAAFFALGMAQNQKRPVAVVCTSGSALLNYYPAVAEAYYSDIPLLVVSSDRPPYKIDVGDGQTIRQDNVFDRHIGYSANLKLDVSHATKKIQEYQPDLLQSTQKDVDKFNLKELETALDIALIDMLPVHINIPFEEPLYELQELESRPTLLSNRKGLATESKQSFIEFADKWKAASKKMVLVGVNYPNEIDQSLLDILAKDPSVIVFTETTSNLHHPEFFASIDSIIFPIEKSAGQDDLFKNLQPEILLTFGGLVVSKKVKAFLRKYRPKEHWHINEIRAFDTYFSLTEHVKTNPEKFLRAILKDANVTHSDYAKHWKVKKLNYRKKRAQYLKEVPFTDFSAFHIILQNVPKNYQLQLSNSSVVRYAQLFDVVPTLKVFCNRGTSGIDGSTSTAIGASYYETSPTLLITGDLSFFYDSNALWINYIKSDFRIILMNNSGGGIFRILPGNDGSETFERYFETKQNLNAEHLCHQYGLEYLKCGNKQQLENSLNTFFKPSAKPRVLEIFTPRELNDKILLGYFDFIS
ncbi:2-succinyl-5-enolpyruvyl-6-hydroxy-3-cyclohexene-1-carboxylic-acid synthase [Muricauda sp. DJ-13]|uniref:2-succinyl-5-enolpyruvyl-6-hydroxy-3-cyclohexene-1-carboxylate synthase n=2 Tax=Croceivirga thetidis TaxID=2721623 RepID=A0ABX1GQA3_9FLAO|nr:2-succinyl-5-enolpyruvyl-6-hydroxy-3-cyclohexene-1-carboxylic-acid synthase [Croceivirga thetidis]NKI32101.1 2-succinyl-5-enolpyruvyl-6-hydroxy-3-cyclohexene-1-carboxylic-acid synthase [Croceivirga thetidis]